MINCHVHGLHIIVFLLFMIHSCFATSSVDVPEMQKIPGYAVPVQTDLPHLLQSCHRVMDGSFQLKTSIRVFFECVSMKIC